MNSKILTSLSVLLLTLAIGLQILSPLWSARAEESSASSSESASNSDRATDSNRELCPIAIAPDIKTLEDDILSFLSDHYTSDSPASALQQEAFLKFKEYRTNMRALLLPFSVQARTQSLRENTQERQACRQLVEDHIRSVQAILYSHHVSNAGSKTTFRLVTKMKSLNDKLRELNRDFGEFYAAFKTFVDKVPNTTK